MFNQLGRLWKEWVAFYIRTEPVTWALLELASLFLIERLASCASRSLLLFRRCLEWFCCCGCWCCCCICCLCIWYIVCSLVSSLSNISCSTASIKHHSKFCYETITKYDWNVKKEKKKMHYNVWWAAPVISYPNVASTLYSPCLV